MHNYEMPRIFSLPIDNQTHQFVRSESIIPLSAYIPLAHDLDSFTHVVRRTASETGRRLSGYITSSSHEVNSFTLTAYPRNKYGTLSPHTFRHLAQTLAHGLNAPIEQDPLAKQTRILFGLIEGYEDHGKLHTIQEVAHSLGDVALQPATIFASHLRNDGSIADYREPAVVITTSPEGVETVLWLADKFGQERVVVEDFANQHTYSVETRHCTEPDEQFPAHVL